MKSLFRASVLGLMLATASAVPAAIAQAPSVGAERMPTPTTLNLSAYGDVRMAPDMATISLGVNTEAVTAAAALQANATQMTKVFAALKKAGIAEKDIQTSGLNLNAQYDYVQNEAPKLRGYQATNQVSVTVRALNRLGPAIDATVSAGINQVNGISFGISDPGAAENAAREKAVKALIAKANLYAAATGYKVSRLVTLSEGGGYSPPQPTPMYAMARMEKMADSTPVAAGEMTIRIDVNAVYELTR